MRAVRLRVRVGRVRVGMVRVEVVRVVRVVKGEW